MIEPAAEIWASLYVLPVIGVFILAGAVYFLSFRTKNDASDQSLRNYLNVLSGDDDKNRKAAKKLRKFGSSRQKVTVNGSVGNGDGESKQTDSDTENRPLVNNNNNISAVDLMCLSPSKTVQVSRKVDQVITVFPTSSSVAVSKNHQDGLTATTPSTLIPEVVADDDGVLLSTVSQTDKEAPLEGVAGWHKAVSRKDKKMNNAPESKSDDTTNHSTTSDESRPSFKNSCSSRNSSPYRHGMTYQPNERNRDVHSRKFTSRKAAATAPIKQHHQPHLLQRPDHLKLESSNQPTCNVSHQVLASPPTRPTILLTKATENHIPFPFPTSRNLQRIYGQNVDHSPKTKSTLSGHDICIQTDEDQDYPSPLEGLRQVDEGQPRFVIMMDFSVQVDLDSEDGIEPEIVMHYEDGDKLRYSSGGSLSSGDGSTRVTPVLEDEFGREFRITAEKSQGVHRRSLSYSVNSRQSSSSNHYQYPQSLTPAPPGSTRRDDGSGDNNNRSSEDGGGNSGGGGSDSVKDRAYFVTHHKDLRSCRAEKASNDWIDNSSRRGRPINGRWRN